MSTNATFVLPNDDGSFSLRYHHWDGYPEGLGLLLHEVVNTPKKVQWLFGLNRDFSTLMRSKPNPNDNKYMWDEYKQSNSIEWPSTFTGSKIENRYIAPLSDKESCINHDTWANISSLQQHQEYNYMWDDKKWNVVLQYGNSFSSSVFMDIPTFIMAREMLSALEGGQNIEQWSWAEFSDLLDVSEKEAQKMIARWQKQPVSARQILCDQYCGEENTEFVQQLDAWLMNQTLSKTVSHSSVASRARKI